MPATSPTDVPSYHDYSSVVISPDPRELAWIRECRWNVANPDPGCPESNEYWALELKKAEALCTHP